MYIDPSEMTREERALANCKHPRKKLRRQRDAILPEYSVRG